jgi:hypothetical protein
MKITKKVFPYLILSFALIFGACSDDNDNFEQNDFDAKSFNVVATYKNVTVGQGDNEVYSYFVNEQLQHKIIYNQDISKSSEEQFSLTIINNNTIRIENPNDSSEYYELRNVNTVNGSKTFDIYTSDGQFLPNVELNSTMVQAKCPWCWVAGGVVAIVEAIVGGTTDSDCQTAVKECREAGGLPSTEIEDGFFGSSCSVTCAEKTK